VDYLDGQLHAIGEVGLENYLAQQLQQRRKRLGRALRLPAARVSIIITAGPGMPFDRIAALVMAGLALVARPQLRSPGTAA